MAKRIGVIPDILTILVCAILACAAMEAGAQPAQPMRIGILSQAAPPPPVTPSVDVLVQGLRELGYEDGRNVILELRYGANSAEHLAELAAELVRLKVAVITTAGDLSTRAAQQATSTIPIVAVVGFPIESGFVASLAKPGGNITGVAVQADELAAKRLELLKEAIPGVTRVAVLWDPVTSPRQLRAAEAAARALKLELQVLEARAPGDLKKAFESAAKGRAEALAVLVSPFFSTSRQTLIDLAAKSRLPTIYPAREFVAQGGLMGYGPITRETYRVAAALIDKVLKGAKPGDLPVRQPTAFELSINLKAAKALGLMLPAPLLIRADQVIE